MKHTFISLALAAMLTVSFLPQPAAAYRVVWLNRQQQDQSVQVSNISPGDTDAAELLTLLGITLQATDPVWQDQAFVSMVLKYKEIKAESLALVSDVGDIVVDAFELADYLSQVDHETFQSQYAMTPEEREELRAMRAELEARLAEFQRDPEAFLSQFFGELPENGFGFEDEVWDDFTEMEDGALSAYGYPDPYEAVEAGRVVWLIDGSYSSTDQDWTSTWTQLDGPEVSWLQTDSAHDRAFIMPTLGEDDMDYLTFELLISDEMGNESATYVYVDGIVADADQISAMYEEIIGEEIYDEDWTYWASKQDAGMTLEEIRKHFELFAESGW